MRHTIPITWLAMALSLGGLALGAFFDDAQTVDHRTIARTPPTSTR